MSRSTRNAASPLPPAAAEVIEQFLADLAGTGTLEPGAAERLDALLCAGGVPKAEDIDAALFGQDGDGPP